MSEKVVNLSFHKKIRQNNRIKIRRAVRQKVREIAALSINQAFIDCNRTSGAEQLDRDELLLVFIAEMRKRVVLPLVPRQKL